MRRIAFRLVAALSLAVGGCRERGGGDFAIGAAGEWSDANTQMTRWGIEMAIDEANASAVGSAKLRLVFLDDSASGTGAVRTATQFVDDPAIVAVLGHLNSGPMSAAAPIYHGRLAAVSPSASAAELRGISPWFFRTIPNDTVAGAALARFAMRLGGRAVILYENDSYGRGLANAFRDNYEGEVVSMDAVSPEPGEIAPLVTYLARVARPHVVFMAGVDGTGRAFLREAKRQGLKAAFLGGDGWIGITDDTAAAEGAYVAVPFDANDSHPAAQAFARAFGARYGRPPDAYAALAYDAATVVAAAVAAANGDRRQVRDHLAALRTVGGREGVSGRLSFDSAGDRETRDIVITRVRRGALTALNAP